MGFDKRKNHSLFTVKIKEVIMEKRIEQILEQNPEIIIPQRQSGTGSMYSLESDMYDRKINFGDKYLYAVVLPAFYGGTGITRHKTLDNALKAFPRNYEGARIISPYTKRLSDLHIQRENILHFPAIGNRFRNTGFFQSKVLIQKSL